MQVYGTNLHPAWVALCCTPVVGTAISFVGVCKWGNKAEDLTQPATAFQAKFTAGRGGGKGTMEEPSEQEMAMGTQVEEVLKKQTVYAFTSVVSSVLGLALMVQSAATPIFAICAAWTALYAVGAFCAWRQVDAGIPYTVSIFVRMARALNNSVLI